MVYKCGPKKAMTCLYNVRVYVMVVKLVSRLNQMASIYLEAIDYRPTDYCELFN